MSSAAVWYAARGAGIVAYLLVTATVLLGVTLSGRRLRALPRFAVEDVHRFLGLLAGTFVTIHVVGIALDTVVPFSLTQLVVPFTAGYRPLWTGLGVVALELLVALAVTNRLRGRLPHRVWRTLHGGSFVVWGLATCHGVFVGTDRDATWARLVYGLAVAAVVTAVIVRLSRRPVAGRALAAAAALGSAAAVAVVGLTAVSLPSSGGTTAVAPSSGVQEPARLSGPFSGTIEEQDGTGAVLVSVSGTAGSAGDTAVRIDLLQTRAGTDTALQLRFPSGVGCTGDLTAIDATGFSGTCTTPGGSIRRVAGSWSVDAGQVEGTLDVAGPDGSAA